MRTTHFLPLALLSLVATGCVRAQATMLTPNRYSPVPADEVSVYLATDEIPAGCERIALIHAAGDATWTSERQMIRAARKEAGKAGANAVALRSLDDPDLTTRVVAEIFDVPADRKGQMIGYRCPPNASMASRRSAGRRARTGSTMDLGADPWHGTSNV